MRMMLRFTLPVEKGNQAFNDGSLGRTMESVMTRLKPEAAYFAPLDGKRSGMLFFDIAEPSQIVEVVEPLFLNLDAAVEIVPVMNAEDLRSNELPTGLRPTSKRARFPTPVPTEAGSMPPHEGLGPDDRHHLED